MFPDFKTPCVAVAFVFATPSTRERLILSREDIGLATVAAEFQKISREDFNILKIDCVS